MIVAAADTHALLWYLWNDRRLTAAARQVFESAAQTDDQIAVSSISLVELVYLIDKSRVPPDSLRACIDLFEQDNSLLQEIPVNSEIAENMQLVPRDQIPDMPDRVIAATANHLQVPLITRDHRIQSATISTIW